MASASDGDLLAQPADMHVDRARAARVLVAPHVGQHQVARQHAASMLQEVLQEQELLGGEADVTAVDGHHVLLEVHADLAVRAGRALSPLLAPTVAIARADRRSKALTRATTSLALNGLVM